MPCLAASSLLLLAPYLGSAVSCRTVSSGKLPCRSAVRIAKQEWILQSHKGFLRCAFKLQCNAERSAGVRKSVFEDIPSRCTHIPLNFCWGKLLPSFSSSTFLSCSPHPTLEATQQSLAVFTWKPGTCLWTFTSEPMTTLSTQLQKAWPHGHLEELGYLTVTFFLLWPKAVQLLWTIPGPATAVMHSPWHEHHRPSQALRQAKNPPQLFQHQAGPPDDAALARDTSSGLPGRQCRDLH